VEADVLIHDSQYTDEEYAERIGWGHSSYSHVLGFAGLCKVNRLMTFHHDPAHSDDTLDQAHARLQEAADGFEVVPGTQGAVIDV
jgi:ribonuclease BN (tRNA processing enzyme)